MELVEIERKNNKSKQYKINTTKVNLGEPTHQNIAPQTNHRK